MGTVGNRQRLPHHHARTIYQPSSSSHYLLDPAYHSHRNNRPNSSSAFTKSEYIHPLSQIVLEHLQSSHGQWVQRVGLDTGLKLNKDGTFVLRFPSTTVGHDEVAPDDDDQAEQGDSSEEKMRVNGSIWTMYESEEKKHYLCITKGSLVGRYMLQDNMKPAWHSDKISTPEKVQDAVDEMIGKLQGTVHAV